MSDSILDIHSLPLHTLSMVEERAVASTEICKYHMMQNQNWHRLKENGDNFQSFCIQYVSIDE